METSPRDPYRLAASLLWLDRRLITPLIVILAIPAMVPHLVDHFQVRYLMPLSALDRALQLLVLYGISLRWLNQLRSTPLRRDSRSLAVLLMVGFSLWAMITIPVTVQLLAFNSSIKSFFLLLLIPAVLLTWRYFFYFVPIVLGVRSLTEILNRSNSYIERNFWSPIQILVAPTGITLILCSIPALFSPDGRELFWVMLHDGLGGFFWIISLYLHLGFVLVLMPENTWSAESFDPYRQARLDTLEVQAPKSLGLLLKPRNGVTMIAIGALIWTGNTVRLSQLPPSVELEARSITTEENLVRMTLRVRDPAFRFRGFAPIHFALANEKRTTIADAPTSASLPNFTDEILYSFPRSEDELDLTVSFETSRSGPALTKLKDLYLWYRYVKLYRVNLNKGTLEQIESTNEGAVEEP